MALTDQSYRTGVIALLLMIFSIISFAQDNVFNPKPDERLFECFDSTYIETLIKTESVMILYMNFFLDSSYFITDIPKGKEIMITDIRTVTIVKMKKDGKKQFFNEDLDPFKPVSFNVYKYNFTRNFNQKSFYKLGDTGKMLVFYSGEELNNTFNKYKNRLVQ